MAAAAGTERGSSKKVNAPAAAVASPDRMIVQERIFDAPRELVWRAWTDQRHLDQWWGPSGFRNETSAVEGGQQTLARLAGHLPYLADGSADRAMVLTRLFDAPVGLVFQAWSSPKALAQWWGPKDFTLPECEVDFRVGGAYRMSMQGPD